MVAALYGLNVAWIKTFFAKSGSRSVHFHTNPATTARFIQALKDTVVATDRPSLTWTEHMLSLERNARPTAARVLETITSPEHDDTSSTANVFCDICCVPDYESDSMDSLVDYFDVITTVPCADANIQAHQSSLDQASETGMAPNTVQAAKLISADRRSHHDVFGTPIWISMCYAETSRSIKQDFDIAYDFKCDVPIVIAKCCTFIFRRSLLDDCVDLTYFSKDVFEEGQEHIGALVSDFESPPTYGASPWYHNAHHAHWQASTTLMYYLQSLPQEIIPPKIAKKLLPCLLVNDDPSHGSSTMEAVMALQELSRPNRDTLLYLLASS